MAERTDVDLTSYRKHLAAEVRASLTAGGFICGILGLVSSVLVYALDRTGVVQNVDSPMVFAGVAGAYSLAFWAVARTGRVRGPLLYGLFIPFLLLPTGLFVLAHFQMPGGAASYVTGPFSYLYFVMIILTGFVFDGRLSVLAGILSAAGYMFAYRLALPGLEQVVTPDPTLRQDLTAAPIYGFKALMMVFAGLLVAAFSSTVRRLVERTVREEQQKDRISRLFGQYVSEEVKDKIISEKSEISGERRTVVILFSDLRGFSSLAEGKDAADIVALLNDYFDAMVGRIAGAGGVVDKFIGDAVMAVFGGLMPLDNPAAAAVRAALSMREGLADLNRRLAARGIGPLDNGIGLHIGEVLQGPIGSRDRKEFTVIGDAVNTASRLEGLTRHLPHPILLSDAVHALLPPDLQGRCVNVGPTRLKGKQSEVSVFGISQ